MRTGTNYFVCVLDATGFFRVFSCLYWPPPYFAKIRDRLLQRNPIVTSFADCAAVVASVYKPEIFVCTKKHLKPLEAWRGLCAETTRRNESAEWKPKGSTSRKTLDGNRLNYCDFMQLTFRVIILCRSRVKMYVNTDPHLLLRKALI